MVPLLLTVALAAPSPGALRIDACVDSQLDPAALRASVELETAGEDLSGGTLSVSCGARPGILRATVRDETGLDRSAVLDLTGMPRPVRPRVVALALVELVREEPPPEIGESPPEPPPAPPSPPPSARSRPWQLTLGPLLRAFVSSRTLTGGAALELAHRPRPWLGWRVGVSAAGGRTRASDGRVGVVTASLAPALMIHHRAGPAMLFGALGLRVGFGSVRGRADDPQRTTEGSVRGPWLGPTATLGVDLRLGRRAVLSVAAEGGYAAVGVRGRVPGRVGAGPNGTWLMPTVAAGSRF